MPAAAIKPHGTLLCRPSNLFPAASPRSAAAGGARRAPLLRQESSFDRALAALREVARDAQQAAAIDALAARFSAQLGELRERLGEHYQKLLAGAGARAGGGGGGRGGGASAAMSTREELDSLLNLIERIDVGGGGAGGGVAAALAGMRLVGV